MKQILYFFPLNPADRNSGSISRALGLLKYFSDRGHKVDFISKQHWGNYTEDSIRAFRDAKLAENIWVLRRKPIKKNPIRYFFGYKIAHLLHERRLNTPPNSIPNHTTLYLRQQFDELLKRKHYDYVIISYAYWADLIRRNPNLHGSTTIIDTHDLLSSQHQLDTGFDRGVALADELQRLDLFDQIWAISADETYFFTQFFRDKVKYIPMMMDLPKVAEEEVEERPFDLIYVATDNPHNRASAAWFFGEVYPQLPVGIKICVIGTILPHIPEDLPYVERISFVEDLSEYYRRSKVSICPMLTGTGLKIKVVEAMAYGLPVVCTERGVDGIPDKTQNGCLVADNAADFATSIQRLLKDKELYQRQSELGKDCFLRNFERQQVYRKIDKALNRPVDAKD